MPHLFSFILEVEVIRMDERVAKVILVLLGMAMIAMYAYGWYASANNSEWPRIPFS
jgi:hypothetical protein